MGHRHVTKYTRLPPPPGEVPRKGRKPQGERALTGAERQALYRQRQADKRPAPPRHRSPPLRRFSRRQRWLAAVGVLVALQAEYAGWLDALPEVLRDGATGEALQAIVDLDLEELQAIDPPRGYGRD